MSENIFSSASFFLLRIPVWSIAKKIYLDSTCDPFHDVYQKNDFFREAIFIASPSLHHSLSKKITKKLNQATQSLAYYISRMIMRSTPFGLFSSVSVAEWGESTTISYDAQLLRKRTRLDMEWVYSLVHKLYQNNSVLPLLLIRANPLIQSRRDSYYLNYQRGVEEAENKTTLSTPLSTSIHKTSLIQHIVEFSKNGLTVEQLWLKLYEELPFLERDKTLDVVRTLLSQQFLIPDILPSLLTPSPFDDLSPVLKWFPETDIILEKIKNYDHSSLGCGEEGLNHLQDRLKELTISKNYVQVDLAYDGTDLKLSKIVLNEVERAVEAFWKIASIKKTSSNLTNYHSKFLEKYGEYRIVPLLELLDDDKGLGSSFENSNPPSSNLEWDKWLNKQWQECLFQKKYEWVLSEEDLDAFLIKEQINDESDRAPLSFDLLCKIFANSCQDIDQGHFSVLISEIYQEGASSFGRFLDLFNHSVQAKVAQFFAEEEQLEPKSLFVELSYFPAVFRGANVALHPCLRKHRLDIQESPVEEGALRLEDIYVGATASNFYLTEQSGQFNIITRENHLLNVDFAPAPIKFMRYVTRSQYNQLSSFSWGSIQNTAVFLPRVRLGKTLLAPAKWNLDPDSYLNETDETKHSLFKQWCERWNLPESFFLVQGDQQILLDRNNSNHVQEVLNKLKKNEVLKFVEKIEGAWIEGNEGNHYSELCIPFVRKSKFAKTENSIKMPSYLALDDEERVKFPGSDWCYIKLYMNEESINEFLLRHLYNFIATLNQLGVIKKWFIIRYRDPESHIRLRLHCEPSVISKVLLEFEKQYKLWSQQGWLKDVLMGNYERELERYGGPSLIETVETVFCYDTLSVIHTLHTYSTIQARCQEIVLHALSIVNFLRNFNLDIDHMISCLKALKLDKAALKGFRDCKNQLIALVDSLLNQTSNEIPEIYLMNMGYEIRKNSMQVLCEEAARLEKDRWLSIINSLLHMHCNRLGCMGTKEIQAKIYALQALLSTLKRE